MTTLASWFDDHPKALDLLVKCRTNGVSWRRCVTHLRDKCGYPFKDGTNLATYYRRHGKKIKAAVKRTEPPSFKRTARDLKALEKSETFFVTSAVSNCKGDPGFVEAIEKWAGFTGGKVLVNPVLYKNPTRQSDAQAIDPNVWWDDELVGRGWMLEDELRPHSKLVIMTTKPQATANNPLPPRMESLTKDRSAIIGHPQIAMRTVATPQDELPKILYSSGAVTEKHYSDTPTGDIAEFHHSLGGVIVEVRGDKFHLREVVYDGEQFIDVDTSFSSEGAYDAPRAEALVMGDIHAPWLPSEDVMEATFGPAGILEATQAKRLMLHDLADMASVNPHERGSRLTRAAMFAKGRTNLARELRGVREWLERFPGEYLKGSGDLETFVVASNHDAFLHRWLESGEHHVEPENRALYHHLSAEMLDYHAVHDKFPSALELGLRRSGYQGGAKFLGIDESLRIMGVELGMHGHLGPNGARGSAKGLSRIGTRSIIGHSHSSMIWQGVYQAGHSSRNRHGYNVGPSSWLTTHVLLLGNGRRQMIHLIGKDWRGC